MINIQVVIDTNVYVSALKNDTGTSFLLLTLIGKNDFVLDFRPMKMAGK